MSQPISQCLIVKATTDEAAYQRLLKAMKYNKACGHYSVWPCECEHQCAQPDKKLRDKLSARLEKDLEGVECTGGGLLGTQGPAGPVGEGKRA
jgi:hypothetical protein